MVHRIVVPEAAIFLRLATTLLARCRNTVVNNLESQRFIDFFAADDILGSVRVESRRGLVTEKQRRLRQNLRGKTESLLLTARYGFATTGPTTEVQECQFFKII